MKVEPTFTFIISRNFGHPLTWNVKAWRVYLGLLAGGAALVAMLAMSALYLINVPRVERLERQREELRQERDALRDQLQAKSEAALLAKAQQWVAARQAQEGAEREPDFDEETEELYVQPVRLESFSATRRSSSLEARFRIVRQGDAERNRGGFIFAIFEDQTVSPPRYAASPHVEVNEEGFPQYYKGGIRFSRIRHAQTYRRQVRLRQEEGRFTHVTIYLFSLRGGLLAKERYPLDPALFTAST